MFRIPISWLAIALIPVASAPNNTAARPDTGASPPKAEAASAGQPSDDGEAAHQLLDLANHARLQAGLQRLEPDAGLEKAAASHAVLMASEQQLSHQFANEPQLLQRLTVHSNLHLDRAGENVAFAASVQQAHDGFMHSPAHRDNLLNPVFNLAGISVVRSAGLLYVTEDFGHGVHSHSGNQTFAAQDDEDAVVQAVTGARTQAGLTALRRTSMPSAHSAACSMAQTGSLNGPPVSGRRVVRYTAFSPSELPPDAAKVIASDNIQELSVGACYSPPSNNSQSMLYVVLVLN